MESFARWLVRHPLAVVLANLAVTLLLGVFALRIRIETSLESVLPQGDPEVAEYARARQTFGSDDIAVVGVRADDVFAASTLEKIARVTESLSKIDGVQGVVSITNVVDPAADVIDPPKLLPRIPPALGEIEALEAKLARTPIYGKNLVADDFKGAAINVVLKNLSYAEYVDLAVDRKIQAVLDANRGPEKFFFTGASHITEGAIDMLRRDLVRFTPIALALVLLVLWLSFRTVRGVVLPAISVVMALAWTLGVMVLAGQSITLGTFVLPPLLLVIGSSYAIHVMARYYEQVDAGAPRAELVVRAFQRVWLPLAISALTTFVGFASLLVNRITAIRDLGLYAAIGVSFLVVTSLTFMPAALELMPVEARTARSGKISPALTAFLGRLGRQATCSRKWILGTSLLLTLAGFLGARLIQVDSDFLNFFRPSAPVRRDNEVINREIVGSNTFYLVVEGDEPDLLKRWEVLKQLKDLQQFLLTLPGVTSSLSLVDYLELLETGLHRGDEGDIVLDEHGKILPREAAKSFWEDPKSLAPVLQLVAAKPETFKSAVTPDFRTGNILVRTNLSGSRRIEATLVKVRDYIGAHFPPSVRVRPTGSLVVLTGTASDIVAGQIKSLALALGVIFVVMSLMFLSTRIGALAILPNVVPIVIFFGVMGWCGVLLNLGTSLIAAIALGIAVDSTIHFMARLNLELKGRTDQAEALERTLQTVGVPIVYATVTLLLGFLIFAFSSFVPIQQFGWLAAMTMAVGLVANLALLPALLSTSKIITIWDLVMVKLGKDPERTIPLFAGLRPAQARIVVLMGQLKRFSAGQSIVTRGETGDEMYVVINGTAEVWIGEGRNRRRIAEHRRGEVFGEMALVRRSERSATVVAVDDVEVLAVNDRFLERIQFRYPRIAARLFRNLARIVSDRLQRATDRLVAPPSDVAAGG